MSSKTYIGVTALPRYVVRTQTRGRTYYYFRRRRFPIVRLPGEPGSVLFTDTYTAALRATDHEGFTALRKHMQEHRSRRPDAPHISVVVVGQSEADNAGASDSGGTALRRQHRDITCIREIVSE